MTRFLAVFVGGVLVLAGCGSAPRPLSARQVADFAPTTKTRVLSVREVPKEVRDAAFSALEQRILKDRDERWNGGCMAGVRFLEAGETTAGWWVYYESGGIVDLKRIVVLERKNGALEIVAEKGMP